MTGSRPRMRSVSALFQVGSQKDQNAEVIASARRARSSMVDLGKLRFVRSVEEFAVIVSAGTACQEMRRAREGKKKSIPGKRCATTTACVAIQASPRIRHTILATIHFLPSRLRTSSLLCSCSARFRSLSRNLHPRACALTR